MKKYFILFGVILILILPFTVLAKIGVGIATGKIQIDYKLKSGLIYTLPPLTFVNTGDEPSEYGVGVQYHEDQPELKPKKEWFSFKPLSFYLEPEQTQVVQVKLNLPIRDVEPGDYFAFVQGFPTKKAEAGKASVGVAAATKLYFTVAPANIFVGIYYRIGSIIKLYQPWSYVVLVVFIISLLIVIFHRFFSINIGIGIKKKNE